MPIKKIHTFGDGYASNHIWPEWPWLLEALVPEVEFEHHGQIGAGNEFISNAAIQVNFKDPDAFFLVQWAEPCRFDKLLQDTSWDHIIDSDPVYAFNRVSVADQKWWISSKSQQPQIQSYHEIFVQSQQHECRMSNLIYLMYHLLRGKSLFFSTQDIHRLVVPEVDNFINVDMISYSWQSRFLPCRQNQVQPSPPVHLDRKSTRLNSSH